MILKYLFESLLLVLWGIYTERTHVFKNASDTMFKMCTLLICALHISNSVNKLNNNKNPLKQPLAGQTPAWAVYLFPGERGDATIGFIHALVTSEVRI